MGTFVYLPSVALTGYIRYTSGTVDNGGKYRNGEQDKGQVFIALGDWEGQTSVEKLGR